LTPQEYADVLRLKISELTRDNKPLKLAATTSTVEMASRIFVQGKSTAGDKIGDYSTKGIYLSDKFLSTLRNIEPTHKGKTGRSKFKNGDEHKSTYFEGWKGVRDEAGRQTEKVDLSFVADLQSEFTNTPFKPFNPSPVVKSTPRFVDVNTYEIAVTSEANVNKARGNEKHFNKEIFEISEGEKKLFYDVAEFELKKLFS